MALLKKKMICPCPTWYIWLVIVIGVILALAEMGYINLMGLTWGPVAIVLFGLGCLLSHK